MARFDDVIGQKFLEGMQRRKAIKEKKEAEKKAFFLNILGLAGTAIGAAFGGPVGATIGGSIGRTIGGGKPNFQRIENQIQSGGLDLESIFGNKQQFTSSMLPRGDFRNVS